MKKLFLLLLLPVLGTAQSIITDSITANGRYAEIQVGKHRLLVNTDYPLQGFSKVDDLLVTHGDPYFGILYTDVDINSEITLKDLFHSNEFNEQFPNSEITFGDTHTIKNKKFEDGVFTQVNIYAVSNGLLWFFFKVQDQPENAQNKISKFLTYTRLQERFYQ